MSPHTFILQHTEDGEVYEYAFVVQPNKRDSLLSVQMKAITLAKLRVMESNHVRVGGYPRLLHLEDDLSLRLLSGPDALLVRG